MKELARLTVHDLLQFPIWEYVDEEEQERDVILVRPICTIPEAVLRNRFVGTQVTLANGSRVWAILGNIHPRNMRSTRHFLTISLERNGKWFDLARYHDIDYPRRGASGLAAFLGLRIGDVFPISFDISPVITGHPEVTHGIIVSEPNEKLSDAGLIELSLEE